MSDDGVASDRFMVSHHGRNARNEKGFANCCG
jgi:hypothetical protein